MDGTDGLFYIDGEDRLTTMVVTPYQAEDVLQALLSRHPDLLAGGQMDPHNPRRWLLVAREQGVPDRDDATSSRWSVDHLFVDQDAVPTLVEVKRSSDTRIRREVVGQMLDYAANGVLYWPEDRLREAFSRTQEERRGVDPSEALVELTGDPEQTVAAFFGRVSENLRAGRVRLVFVADIVPDELQRIVEFLNIQMSPAEVFAVEVKQYAAAGFAGRTMVPRVIGRTGAAMVKQGSKTGRTPEEYRASASPAARELSGHLHRWADTRGLTLTETPQARQVKRPDGSTIMQLYYSFDTLDIDLVAVRIRAGEAHADGLIERLQALTTKKLTRSRPAVPVQDLVNSWSLTEGILDELLW